MAKRQNIVKYRERLDKTLTSFDLTNDEKLKTLVKSQLHRSSQLEMELEGYKEKLEIKTAELSNFLNMIRSASADESGGSNALHTDWKLKQDTEELRVMYHEGPEGTPFHTLLVEGYVDGPVDVCLGLSWEASLYKKWWPQFTVPTFKVTVSECLQKVQTGEQISLVRVKPPWPVSTREAIVHFYLFEYYQDDLVVVLMKSVPESKRINEVIDGFNNDVIPGAKGVVRMDLVGGFVLQKVTSERSYFRTIANLDIKMDFMPPSLINFISRQLIGSGFRLYQKAVASKMNKDREFSKALTDPLYVRIREALYNIDEEKEELKQYASILPVEELSQSKQDAAKDISREDRSNQYANNYNGEILDAGSEEIVQGEEGDTFFVLKGNRNCEIVDAESEEIVEANIEEIVDTDSEEIVQIEKYVKKINDIPIEEANIEEIVQIEKYNDTRGIMKGKSNVYISSNVKQALETLERAISVVRKYGFHSRRFSFRFVHEETRCKEKSGEVDPYSANPVHPFVKNDVSVKGPSGNVVQESSEDFYEIQNIRHTGTDPNLKELNYNTVPAFRNKNLIEANQVDSHSLKNGTTQDHIICDDSKQYRGRDMRSDDPIKSSRQRKINNLVTQGISSDVPKQLSKRKNYRYCCFTH